MTQATIQANLLSLIEAHKDNYLYTVVDAASDDKIHHMLQAYESDSYSLYFGDEAENLEQVAPYLIKLKKGDLFTDWYIKNVYGNTASILITSTNSELELQAHLQNYVKPLMEFETEEDIKFQEVFLAFYDPRVFPNYLRSISLEHRVAFLQPFKAIFYEGSESATLNQLLLSSSRDDVTSTTYELSKVLTFETLEEQFLADTNSVIDSSYQPIIDLETNSKLLAFSLQVFVSELLDNLSKDNPVLASNKNEKDAHKYIYQQVKEVQSRGINNEAAMTYYIQLKLDYGTGFASDPQYQHLTQVLNNETISDINKADILFDAFEDYEKQVYGEDNAFFDRAYQQANKLSPEHLINTPIESLLHHIYPEKYQHLQEHNVKGLEALTSSAQNYTEGKNWENTNSIVLVIMFLFGHQFYNDFRLQALNQYMRTLTTDPTAEQLVQLLQAGVSDHG